MQSSSSSSRDRTSSTSSNDLDGYTSSSSQDDVNSINETKHKDEKAFNQNQQSGTFTHIDSNITLIQPDQIPNKKKQKIYRLKGMHYNQQFDPEFSIGMYLRSLNIAINIEEEVSLAEKWKLQVRIPIEKMTQLQIDQWNLIKKNQEQFDKKECKLNDQKIYQDLPLKTINDSDIFTKADCTFVLMRKTKEEIDLDKDLKKNELYIPRIKKVEGNISCSSSDSVSKQSDQSLSNSSSSESDSSGDSVSSSSKSSVSKQNTLKSKNNISQNKVQRNKSKSNRVEATQILAKRPERKRATKDLDVMRLQYNRNQRQKTDQHGIGTVFTESFKSNESMSSSSKGSNNSDYQNNDSVLKDSVMKTSSVQIQKIKKQQKKHEPAQNKSKLKNVKQNSISSDSDKVSKDKIRQKKNKQDYHEFEKKQKDQQAIKKQVNPSQNKKAANSTNNKVTIPMIGNANSNSNQNSVCGRYVINQNSKSNEAYIQCLNTIQIINKQKDGNIYMTLKEFQSKLIDKLNLVQDGNQKTSIQYKYTVTPSYVNIKCCNCERFSFWYKNNDGKLMKEICGMNLNKIIQPNINDKLDLKFFRSINQNHLKEKHKDIQF